MLKIVFNKHISFLTEGILDKFSLTLLINSEKTSICEVNIE